MLLFKSFSIENFCSLRSFLSASSRSWNSYHFHQITGSRASTSVVDLSMTVLRMRLMFSYLHMLFTRQGTVWLYNISPASENIFVKNLDLENNKNLEFITNLEVLKVKDERKPLLLPKPIDYGAEIYDWRPGILSNFYRLAPINSAHNFTLKYYNRKRYQTRYQLRHYVRQQSKTSLRLYQRRKGISLYGARRNLEYYRLKQYMIRWFQRHQRKPKEKKKKFPLNRRNSTPPIGWQRTSRRYLYSLRRRYLRLMKRPPKENLNIFFETLAPNKKVRKKRRPLSFKRIRRRKNKKKLRLAWKRKRQRRYNRPKKLEKIAVVIFKYRGDIVKLVQHQLRSMKIKRRIQHLLDSEKFLLKERFKVTMPDSNLIEKYDRSWLPLWFERRRTKTFFADMRRRTFKFLRFFPKRKSRDDTSIALLPLGLSKINARAFIFIQKQRQAELRRRFVKVFLNCASVRVSEHKLLRFSSFSSFRKVRRYRRRTLNTKDKSRRPPKTLQNMTRLTMAVTFDKRAALARLIRNKTKKPRQLFRMYVYSRRRVLQWRLHLAYSIHSNNTTLIENSKPSLLKIGRLNVLRSNLSRRVTYGVRSQVITLVYRNKSRFFLKPKRNLSKSVPERINFGKPEFSKTTSVIPIMVNLYGLVNTAKANLGRQTYLERPSSAILSKSGFYHVNHKFYSYARVVGNNSSNLKKKKSKKYFLRRLVNRNFGLFNLFTRATKDFLFEKMFLTGLENSRAADLYIESSKLVQTFIPYLPAAVLVARLNRLSLSAIIETKSVGVPLMYFLTSSINPLSAVYPVLINDTIFIMEQIKKLIDLQWRLSIMEGLHKQLVYLF